VKSKKKFWGRNKNKKEKPKLRKGPIRKRKGPI
jgi:hypothetical protein